MKNMELKSVEDEKAWEIHKKAIIIDGCVLPLFNPDSVQRMMDGGLTGACVTVPSIDSSKPIPGFRSALEHIADRHHWIEQNSDKTLLASNATDIEKAKREGKVAIILANQNADIIEGNLRFLNIFHNLGVKICQLTYNYKNEIGDGAYERTDGGLSNFGIDVVKEMNRLNMLIDLSHVGKSTTKETLELSKDPVITSHANIKSLCDHARNKTDEQIKALAEKGGLMGITVFATFYKTKDNTQPTIENLVDCIEYVVDLVGINHVGIGTDLDEYMTKQRWASYRRTFSKFVTPEAPYVRGLENVESYFNLTKGLVARGYSEQEIMKILGGNFLRIFKEVCGNGL